MKLWTLQLAQAFATRFGFGLGIGAALGVWRGMAGSSLLLAGWCQASVDGITTRVRRVSMISVNAMPVTVSAGGVTWAIAHRPGVYSAKHATCRVA